MKMIEQKDDKHGGVHLSKLFTWDTNHGCWFHLKNCFVIVTIYHWHVVFTEKQICQMVVEIDSVCQLLPPNGFAEKSQVCAAHSEAWVSPQSRAIVGNLGNESLARQLRCTCARVQLDFRLVWHVLYLHTRRVTNERGNEDKWVQKDMNADASRQGVRAHWKVLWKSEINLPWLHSSKILIQWRFFCQHFPTPLSKISNE